MNVGTGPTQKSPCITKSSHLIDKVDERIYAEKKGEEYPPEKSKLYVENEVNFSTETIYSDKNMGMEMGLGFTIYDYWYGSNVICGLPCCVA